MVMKLWIITALASLALPHFGCSVEEPQPAQSAEAAGSAAPRHPNLLLITLDTTRADALGSYGQPLDTSPNFDRLAARGVLFEQVTTSNPETLPSFKACVNARFGDSWCSTILPTKLNTILKPTCPAMSFGSRHCASPARANRKQPRQRPQIHWRLPMVSPSTYPTYPTY